MSIDALAPQPPVPQPAVAVDAVRVLLIGNPNVGKTTLFNALTGMRQRVGNYAGVTVETRTGTARAGGRTLSITDVPGTYSLSPKSPDEMLAVDLLLGRGARHEQPDVILCIVDASNLERNLYLTTQVMELGVPVVLVANMTDVAARGGATIDYNLLGERLGVTVVPTRADGNEGLDRVKDAVLAAAGSYSPPKLPEFPAPFGAERERLRLWLGDQGAGDVPPFLIERALLDLGGQVENELAGEVGASIREELSAARTRLTAAGQPPMLIESRARYGWIGEATRGVVRRPDERRIDVSDRIDKVVLHRFWGVAIFLAVMAVIFQTIYAGAAPLMDAIDWSFATLGELVGAAMPEGALRSLLTDGLVAGVGAVLIFLPQIMILFGFIAVLEDCGYMARAAFLMDKLMSRCGLSGKSFIPMLSSFACAIPGVMATRTIEDRRDRLTTMLVLPLMSCSARLPVYVILIGAFIPSVALVSLGGVGLLNLQAVVLLSMYLVGVLVAPLVAWTLKATVLKGQTPLFLMELPPYKWPNLRTVVFRMCDRGWAFVRRAGTIILASTVVIWALQYWPRAEGVEARFADEVAAVERLPEDEADEARLAIDNRIAAAYQEQSALGHIGRAIEPAVRPLGWDWRIGMAAVAAFPAREVVVSALGTIYSVGADVDPGDEDSAFRLRDSLRAARWPDGRPVFNVPVALSLMVFFALCSQCVSTLAAIRRETNSWRWPLFCFAYMTVLAYVGAFATYRIGMMVRGAT